MTVYAHHSGRGDFIMHALVLATINLHTKFEDSSFTLFERYDWGSTLEN